MKAARVAPIPTKSQHRRDAELEAWICERLQLRDLFAGVTDTATRRDRLKVLLTQRGLTDAIAGRMNGKPISWRALVKQLYQDDLS
jgi:hypothetical protein